MKKQNPQILVDAWEHAIERATENRKSELPLQDQTLEDAAGLQVRSGVQAGGWTHTFSCECEPM